MRLHDFFVNAVGPGDVLVIFDKAADTGAFQIGGIWLVNICRLKWLTAQGEADLDAVIRAVGRDTCDRVLVFIFVKPDKPIPVRNFALSDVVFWMKIFETLAFEAAVIRERL